MWAQRTPMRIHSTLARSRAIRLATCFALFVGPSASLFGSPFGGLLVGPFAGAAFADAQEGTEGQPNAASASPVQIDVGPPPRIADTQVMDPTVVTLLTERVTAVEANPTDQTAREDLALAYEANTIWSLAEPCYDQVIALSDGSAEWRFRRGIVRYKNGNLDGALEDLGAAAAAYKNTPVVQAWHADVLRLAGEIEAAEAAWRQAIAAEAKQKPPTKYPQSRVGLARTLLDADDAEAAEALCREALAINPGYRHGFFILGRALRDLDRRDEAAMALAQGSNSYPGFPPDPHQRRLDDAARGFSRRMMVIENLVVEQNIEEAQRRLEEILTEAPDNHLVLNLGARLALRSGNVDRARELLTKSMAVAPNEPSTLLEACLLELTQADAAANQLQRMAQMQAQNQALPQDRVDQMRASGIAQADKASEHAMAAVTAAPLIGRYTFWLGMCQRTKAMLSTDQQEQGQLMQAAMGAMQKAGRLGCTEPSFHQQIASIYGQMGRGSQMLTHARQHLKLNPTDPNAIVFLIQAELQNKNNDAIPPLAQRLERMAQANGSVEMLQFTVRVYLTILDYDGAERALSAFESAAAGIPDAAQFIVAVQENIANSRKAAGAEDKDAPEGDAKKAPESDAKQNADGGI